MTETKVYDYNNYYNSTDFYYNYKDKIIEEYNSCISNPCSKVISNIESLIENMQRELEKMSVWNDSVSSLVEEGINNYIKKLEDVNLSISTDWKRAEELYIENYDLLNELNEWNNHLNYESNNIIDGQTIKDGGKLRVEIIMDQILKNFNELKRIGGENISDESSLYEENNQFIALPPITPEVVTETKPDLSALSTTYEGVNIMISDPSEVQSWIKQMQQGRKGGHVKLNQIGYTVRYRQNSDTSLNIPWMSTPGVDCVTISLATGLTSTLSQYYGQQVIVNPTQVCAGLYAYCIKHNINPSKIVKNGNYSGDYKIVPQALKEIWGVDVIGRKEPISIAEATQILQSGKNASLVYKTYNSSGSAGGHAAAATGLTSNGQFIISDTYYSRENWIKGTNNFGSVSGYNFIITKS